MNILANMPVAAAWGGWTTDFLNRAFDALKKAIKYCWSILTTSPERFMQGGTAQDTLTGTGAIWRGVKAVNGALQGVGMALLILFFAIGVVKTCGSFTELKRPEHALKIFLRFIIAKAVVTYSMTIVGKIIEVAQIIISQLAKHTTLADITGSNVSMDLFLDRIFQVPDYIETLFQGDVGGMNRVGLWLVAFIGSIAMYVLCIVLVLTVMGRFFKIYLYTAFAPIPLAFFAGEPTAQTGKQYIKALAAVCLQGVIAMLAFFVFFVFLNAQYTAGISPGELQEQMNDPAGALWGFVFKNLLYVLMLVGIVKTSDHVVKELMAL